MKNRKCGFFKKIFLALFTVGLLCGALELVLRAGVFENQYAAGAALAGELHHPESKGMILGDSFLANWGNGQSLSELLSRELKIKGVQILNTANFGYGPADYLLQMKAYGADFHPQWVLLFYYAGNDLTDMQYRHGWKQTLKPWLVRWRLFHFLKSKLEALRRKGIDYAGARQSGADPEAIRLAEAGQINPWLIALSQKEPGFLLDNLLMETEENRKAWGQAQDRLQEIRRISNRLGADFSLVMIPSTAQVNSSHFDFYRGLGFKVDVRTFHESAPQQRMKEFCEKEKINCLDLLPFFRARKEEEFYRAGDDHFNREGNEFAKSLVMDFLKGRMRSGNF